jgi:hypothetical protein
MPALHGAGVQPALVLAGHPWMHSVVLLVFNTSTCLVVHGLIYNKALRPPYGLPHRLQLVGQTAKGGTPL